MLATPTRRLRATTGLPQKPFNEEYIWLTGDSAVEANAGDGENVGYAGSGDEALREGGRKKTPNLSDVQVAIAEAGRQDRRRVRFI